VTYWIDSGPKVNPNTIEIRVPPFNAPGNPSLGLPPGIGSPDLLPPTGPPKTY